MKRFNEEGAPLSDGGGAPLQITSGGPGARLIAEMPKAELHLHLDGSLRVTTALELAATRDVDAPRTYAEMFAALVWDLHPTSQANLLRAFELPVALMQDAEALERVTIELIEVKASDNVEYLEIRWAPLLHIQRGLSDAEAIEAVCRGRREGMRRTDATVGLICVAVRSHPPEDNRRLAALAADYQDEGVVALDLAGLEADYPDPLDHRAAFEVAAAAGLRTTVHAGELQDGGAGVRRALELGVPRVAHGATAIADPQLCADLRAREVTLDVCPTSNVQAATFARLEDHPLATLHRLGVPVSISTDDPTISNITLSEELVAVSAATGLTLPELWRINLHGLDVAFVEPDRASELRARFRRWADWAPELAPADAE
jgi:adenosine deaminase